MLWNGYVTDSSIYIFFIIMMFLEDLNSMLLALISGN